MSNPDVDKLMEALRRVVNAALDKALKPADFDYAVLWWEPYSDSGSTSKTEIRSAKDFDIVARCLNGHASIDNLVKCANDIRKIKWPEYLRDATAETICNCYFSSLGSVAIAETVLRQIAEKYVAEVQSDVLNYGTIFQVSHFTSTNAFNLDEKISFRPVSGADINHFGYEPLPIRRQPRLNKRDWICKIADSFSIDDIDGRHRWRETLDRLTGALGLTCEGDAWFSLLSSGPTSPFLQGGYFGSEHRIRSSTHGPAVQMEQSDIDRYRNVFGLVNSHIQKNSKNLTLGFRRFRAAAGREVVDDKITDLAIALESLLTPDSSTGEISYKFRMRGAALLPDRFGSPCDRISLMKSLYSARCEIVHGNSSGNSDRLRLMSTGTEIFRLIFDKLARSPTSVNETIAKLDEKIMKGGELSAAAEQVENGMAT
jgi:hypothetical protein